MIRLFCIAVFSVFLFFSCTEEKVVEQDFTPESIAEPVNLTFTIERPTVSVSTRGYADMENWDTMDGWSLWEKYVDGRLFYRVTLFLLDYENRLVAYRDIYKGSSDLSGDNGFLNSNGEVDTNLEYSDRVRVSFLFEDPLHGDIEKLQQGKYRLMAVANYSQCTATNPLGEQQSYSGLNNLTGVIDGIKNSFNVNTGIADFISAYGGTFIDYKLDAGSDRVCAQQPQALSLVKDIALSSGENYLSGELIRTYARIRIVVENNSFHEAKDLTLTVSNLKFSNNYAQRYAYLFAEPDNEDRLYETALSRGEIDLSHDDAIKPFESIDIEEIDIDHSLNNEAVIFDAYILESRDLTNDYTYTLNLEYKSNSVAINEYKAGSQINNHQNLNVNNYYLIRSYSGNNYLTEGSNTVTYKNIASLTNNITEEMIWKLEANGTSGSYNIRTFDPNSDTYYYMLAPSTNNIGLGQAPSSKPFKFSTNGGGIRMQYDGGSYITFQNNRVYGSKNTNNTVKFYFYPVTIEKKGVSKTEVIPLKTIDNVTSQVSHVTNIKRNDFLNVLVTVQYVPDSENGYFTFVVEGWTKKEDNYIEFE